MNTPSRRSDTLAVHSLDHFAFAVPDLDVARDFYERFGLEVRKGEGGLDLYTYGHPHRWAHVTRGSRKALQSISLGAFSDDLPRFARHFAGLSLKTEPDAEAQSIWLSDPHGVRIEIRAAEKSSPDAKSPVAASKPLMRGAPMRDEAPIVRPRRMSHVAFFTPDLDKTLDFYTAAFGLRLSDRSGPAAFVHGAHGSDHHMLAFIQSTAPGYHHSAWDVGSINDVGLGAAQMAAAGYERGWGLGRHVLGSNYFHYVRDPWGSYAEYSFDMDFVPAGLDWPSMNASPENSLSLWGPAPPQEFVDNAESPASLQH